MKDLHDLELLLNSETPILLIETLEEPRLLQMLTGMSMRRREPMYVWSVTDGLADLATGHDREADTEDPERLLRHIRLSGRTGLYVLLDFHPFMDNPLHVRLIKEIAQAHERFRKTLVLVSHSLEVPAEIAHLTARFRLTLPDSPALMALIKEEALLWQEQTGSPVRADRAAVAKLAQNLVGMSYSDARKLIRAAIRTDGAISRNDLPEIMRAKDELLNADGVISFEYATARFSEVAGLRNLKDWLNRRKAAFEGRLNGLDRPKGILLLGVQGGGKSLAAKAVAGEFEVPLLRLDFGTLYNKYYGETEKNLRKALATASVMAPCVLWIDEIEKGVAADRSEDGVAQRVLGTLLTWMAENRKSVFIVATANDIQRLPPELIRKGRLDELFFVDLPDVETRKAIFEIHLRQRNIPPGGFDLELMGQLSEGFSGAGIEQVVVSALYAAHAVGQPLRQDLLAEELRRTRPLSVVMAEKIQRLRDWAAARTVPAN